jgi:hypothetical protein
MKEYLGDIMLTATNYGYPVAGCRVLLKHCVSGATTNVPIQNAIDNLEVYQKENKIVSFTIILPPESKKPIREPEPKIVPTEESE